MTQYVVTGVGGYIGNAVAENLLADGVPASDIRVTSRSPEALAVWRAKGADAREADYNDRASLVSAFEGADHLFLVSGMDAGPTRQVQHTNAVEAAIEAGVGHIVYTSFNGAERPEVNSVEVADHKLTERLIIESGIPYNFLRNNQYADAMAENQAAIAITTGQSIGNSADGKVGFVAREDVAEVGAKVLQGLGEPNTGYAVTGPELLTYLEVTELIIELSGAQVAHVDLDDEAMYAMWDSLGVPRDSATGDFTNSPVPWSSDGMVSFGRMIRDGHLAVTTDVVERFTGHQPKSLRTLMEERKHTWPPVAGSGAEGA